MNHSMVTYWLTLGSLILTGRQIEEFCIKVSKFIKSQSIDHCVTQQSALLYWLILDTPLLAFLSFAALSSQHWKCTFFFTWLNFYFGHHTCFLHPELILVKFYWCKYGQSRCAFSGRLTPLLHCGISCGNMCYFLGFEVFNKVLVIAKAILLDHLF
jgi:hypothetical protein